MNYKLMLLSFFVLIAKGIIAQPSEQKTIHVNFIGGTLSNIDNYYLSEKAGWIALMVDKQLTPKFYVGIKTQMMRFFELTNLNTKTYSFLNEHIDIVAFLKLSTNSEKRFIFSGNLGAGIVKSEYAELSNFIVITEFGYLQETQILIDPFVDIKLKVAKNIELLALGGMNLFPQNMFGPSLTNTYLGDVYWIPYYGIGLSIKLN